MKKVYLSHLADIRLKNYLTDLGYELELIFPKADVDAPIACHPDIYMCHLGQSVFCGDSEKLTHDYPGHAIYNGCSTGKYFIHNLKITDRELLNKVENLGLVPIHVSQGYAKCSCIVVDKDSIITADRGIAKAASMAGLAVLVVEPGQIVLEGYPYGFIGGASGKIDNTIVFNGDLSSHSDYLSIKDFIERRGLNIKFFEDYPLTDIGSIIQE